MILTTNPSRTMYFVSEEKHLNVFQTPCQVHHGLDNRRLHVHFISYPLNRCQVTKKKILAVNDEPAKSCDFDEDDFCGWIHGPSNKGYNWKLSKDQMGQPNFDHTWELTDPKPTGLLSICLSSNRRFSFSRPIYSCWQLSRKPGIELNQHHVPSL